MLKKILLFLITLALLFAFAACKDDPDDEGGDGGNTPTPPAEEESDVIKSATIEGTALTWEIDRHGVLTVKGSGAMPDFARPNDQPWYEHGSERAEDRTDAEGGSIRVTKVVIASGVTSIGENCFSDYETLTQVTFAASVKTISYFAFKNCPKLELVQGAFGVETIETSAFKDCGALETVQLSPVLRAVQTSAFQGCGGSDGKMDVTFRGTAAEWNALLALCSDGNAPLKTAIVTFVQ